MITKAIMERFRKRGFKLERWPRYDITGLRCWRLVCPVLQFVMLFWEDEFPKMRMGLKQ